MRLAPGGSFDVDLATDMVTDTHKDTKRCGVIFVSAVECKQSSIPRKVIAPDYDRSARLSCCVTVISIGKAKRVGLIAMKH